MAFGGAGGGGDADHQDAIEAIVAAFEVGLRAAIGVIVQGRTAHILPIGNRTEDAYGAGVAFANSLVHFPSSPLELPTQPASLLPPPPPPPRQGESEPTAIAEAAAQEAQAQ